jgi:hypothetical protein
MIRKRLLIKLTLDQFLQVLGIQDWGVWTIPLDAHTCIEKDEDLQTFICTI